MNLFFMIILLLARRTAISQNRNGSRKRKEINIQYSSVATPIIQIDDFNLFIFTCIKDVQKAFSLISLIH